MCSGLGVSDFLSRAFSSNSEAFFSFIFPIFGFSNLIWFLDFFYRVREIAHKRIFGVIALK